MLKRFVESELILSSQCNAETAARKQTEKKRSVQYCHYRAIFQRWLLSPPGSFLWSCIPPFFQLEYPTSAEEGKEKTNIVIFSQAQGASHSWVRNTSPGVLFLWKKKKKSIERFHISQGIWRTFFCSLVLLMSDRLRANSSSRAPTYNMSSSWLSSNEV